VPQSYACRPADISGIQIATKRMSFRNSYFQLTAFTRLQVTVGSFAMPWQHAASPKNRENQEILQFIGCRFK